MSLAVDSAKPLLDEIVRSLKRLEEVLSYVGILYIGKVTLQTVWNILKGLRTHIWSKIIGQKLKETYGKWAVVTASTGGIGKAYAVELARNGMNIVLVSRNIGHVEEIAVEISEEFGVETEVMQIDFHDGRAVYDDISWSVLSKDVGILVNDIGMLTSQSVLFEDVTEDEMWCTINANVGASPAMTRIVLPGMVKRRRGAIINISSIGAYLSVPFRQMGSASQAFVHSYSRALEYEYRSSGVIVQTVLPVLIPKDPSNTKSGKSFRPYLFRPSTSAYAYHALSTLGYSSCTTGYWAHGILAWFLQMIPEAMLMWSYSQANKPYM